MRRFHTTSTQSAQYHPDLMAQQSNHKMLEQRRSLVVSRLLLVWLERVVHLSSRSCLSCRPCGSVMSSRPDSTPIILLCSSVTPAMRATCERTAILCHCHSALSFARTALQTRLAELCLLVRYPLNPERIFIRIFQMSLSNIDRGAVVNTNQLCKQSPRQRME